MREMHDSVGANLISALAVAEHGDASRRTVATLKRSLTDLRIAVDLLEQVDGDITLLLASFRYRMEPELRAAGWRFDWRVENVPALNGWIWPTPCTSCAFFRGAEQCTHPFRGNVITFTSRLSFREGRPGVEIILADNGAGLDRSLGADVARPRGKGHHNMMVRAKALGAQLTIVNAKEDGTQVSLWLPLFR
jgi:signal transduction histidine kinase